MTSSSTFNDSGHMSSEEYVSDHSSLLSLQPWIFKKEKNQTGEERSKLDCDSASSCSQDMSAFMENPFTEISPSFVNIGLVHGRSKKSLKGRRNSKYNIKSISSVENCLIPQLYKDNLEFEEYVLDQIPTPTNSADRSFFITDGRRVISKSRYEPLPASFENGMPIQGDRITSDFMENVAGVSSLPKLRTPKRKSKETSNERFDITSSSRTSKLLHSKDLLDQVRLFSIGVSVGVISTLLSNRREVEKLNDMLKSSESLVQDLQEELELKESTTVKELANEASGNHESDDVVVKVKEPFELTGSVPESNFPTDKESPKDLPNAELMSEIEAELEAELERLELNMNEHNLDGRLSAFGELDQDFVIDVVHGQLRVDMFINGNCQDRVDIDSESSGSSTGTVHNANTAVSPRELSIRLHEVIQFRLEERIKELENELQNGQKQIQLAEVESFQADRPFSSSDMESSSNQESPNDLAQPLYLNLSGDALDAYDEAYEEFTRMTTREENAHSMTSFGNKITNSFYLSDQSLICGMESIKYIEEEALWEQKSSKGTDDTKLGHEIDEEYDDGDVEGKILIQKIVERIRKGTSAVLHAH